MVDQRSPGCSLPRAQSNIDGVAWIARDRFQIERQSRNTQENVEFSKTIADPKPGERWLLVTSAFHMPRSIDLFRKAGFAVEPYPVD